MTNETRQRIEYYKKSLPHMKEKVVAAAMMLVIAFSVTVTATYAWVTLSTAPEVTSVDTTVTANGNLEIALANGTGTAPGKSSVGDSTGAGNKITAANITWGNLVNLSDPSYGLSNITLRPAALNGTSGLLTNPLYGVGYGEDGRVSTMVTDDDFAYVYFDQESGTDGAFLADLDGSHLGVRAISTVKYENLEGDNTLAELLRYVNQGLGTAKNNYSSMTNESQEPGKSYIKSLQGLIQVYAQNVIDKKSTSTLDITEYVPDLYEMMKYFNDSVMLPVGESYVQMANMLELMKGSGSADAGYTVETLVAASRAGTLPDYIKNNISSLPEYAADYQSLLNYLKASEKGDYSDLTASQKDSSLAYWAYYASKGGIVYWSNLASHINWICDINTATLDTYTMSSLMSNAMKILGNSGTHDAQIHGGAIYRMEKRIGQKMSPKISVTVDATSISSLAGKRTLTALLTTSATDPYDVPKDRDAVKALNTGSFKGDTATAEDTYAMALDLWLRTNAGSDGSVTTEEITETLEDGTTVTTTITKSGEQAYLTLEGAVVMGLEESQAMVKDINGNEQPAYTASFTVDGQKMELDVFERYGAYYFLDAENQIEKNIDEELSSYQGIVSEVTYTPKMVQSNVVVGYEGVNRVWNDEQMAGFVGSGTNTTQGGGSCYVFYADTPADQSRFLDLLGSMRVVFVNAEGRQIGVAHLDTTNYFADTGKVTVPLVLDKNQATFLGTDIDGNDIYGLTPLVKNAATRVTALIYLDGTRLTNDMVLASGDIQGTLNIQFGSSVALMTSTVSKDEQGNITDSTIEYKPGTGSEAIKDEDVMNQFVEVSAKVSPQGPFDYKPDIPATTTLSVTVDGVEPQSVTARFMRKISSTQGVLQDSVTLTGSGSDWSTSCSFNKPGNYVLRSVFVDGVEYDLDSPILVEVKGSSVQSLSCEAITDSSNRATILTANNSYSTIMTLGFSSSDAQPSKVNGIFMDENGRQVNVPFYLKGGEWKGTAKFTTSGTFEMEFVEIDGEIYELSEKLQPTLEILLGLKVRTWISTDAETLGKLQSVLGTAVATNFVLDKARTGDVTLSVTAEIYDNAGNEITGLSNAKVYYGRAGSSVSTTGLDSNLVWDNVQGRYTGAFCVTKAGTYRFSKVTVDSNEIQSYTAAPSIQAMPPEDAYYFNNYTDTYQYAPKTDAAVTIGIAYSNAAAKVEATISNKSGSTVTVVEGVMGLEAEDQGDKSVNLWNFKIPATNNSQEGDWILRDITMYGVYYDDKYYEEEGAGIKIDLSSENIHTKVVNYLNVTVSGTNQEFTNYFMEENAVNDLKVTIADYEGNPIEGLDISKLKVVYRLDEEIVKVIEKDTPESITNEYNYTATGLSSITADGTGAAKDGSATEFIISGLNLQTAGLYNHCTVSFDAGGTTFTAGGAGTTLKYVVNGVLSSNCPQYKVQWHAPTVKITGTDPKGSTKSNPTGGSSYNINVHTGGSTNLHTVSVRNYYEDYYANVYAKVNSVLGYATGYEVSSVNLTLSNAGTKISSSNKATFHYKFYSDQYENSATFTSGTGTAKMDVGAMEGSSRRLLGNKIVNTIDMSYSGITYTLKLSHQIELNQDNKAQTTVEFEIPDTFVHMFNTPAGATSYDGRPITVELPLMTHTEKAIGAVGDVVTEYHYTETKQPISWKTGSGCNSTTNKGYQVTTVKETVQTGTFAEVERTYATSKWTVTSTTVTNAPQATTSTYNANTTRSFASNNNVITAVVTFTDGAQGTPFTSTETIDDLTTKTVVFQNESGAAIGEPSDWSNNGSATVRTWVE